VAIHAEKSRMDCHVTNAPRNDEWNFSRMFLHATELEITIPDEKENLRKTFMADLPADFQDEIARRAAQ
jgi:hypothetical protein